MAETQRTGWQCDKCGKSGAFESPAAALVYDVVGQLERAHNEANVRKPVKGRKDATPECFGLSKIRVWPIVPVAATRETETPPRCEYESADGQQRCILSKHDEHLLAWKARPEASNANPL